MSKVKIQDIISAGKTITFTFTNTKRGENYDFSSGCTMDLNGILYGTASTTINIIGGSSLHAFAKKDETDTGFYLNEYQRATIHNICFQLGTNYPHEAEIGSGNNQQLDYIASSALDNYRS